ncbi:hypothetical protein L7F22_040042 [Adiantum nelumboides]|nr:hypothetical protein [Adiantum nelumboides]
MTNAARPSSELLLFHGAFNEDHWNSFPVSVSSPGSSIASAVAARVSLQPHEKKTVTFSLVWDAPKVKFTKGRSYYRRYTKFYGFSGKAATRLAHDAILDFSKWEDAIIKWQEPVLKNEKLPEWYRFTLFNELYFLVAGGTIWTESETGTARGESLAKDKATERSDDDSFLRYDTQNFPEGGENHSKDNNDFMVGGSQDDEGAGNLKAMSSEVCHTDGSCNKKCESNKQDEEIDDNRLACQRNLSTGSGVLSVSRDEAKSSNSQSQQLCETSSSADLKLHVGVSHDLHIVREGASFPRIHSCNANTFNELDYADSPEKTGFCMEEGQIDAIPEDQKDEPEDSFGRMTMEQKHRAGVVDNQEGESKVGRFLYLEGLEYVMWCTYDVHFYASFALLALFPKLELCIQREFANATLNQNAEKTKFLTDADWGVRKVLGAVPHDLGKHDPWVEVNAYNIHDTSKWKDLNCKFVLQVYRDFVITGDKDFATKAWPSVFTAMAYMDKFDKDRDGLIENDGFPDQTYDTWTVHGVSAYCGGLWLAALQAAASMAEELQYRDVATSFMAKFQRAKQAYEKKLWNGVYFNYDSGTSSNSNSIQADQLAGQMYMYASGLAPLFESEKITSTLRKIFDYNVMKVKGGKFGAVNGMHPDGKVDETCMQSREIWTGVTYLLAATMIHAGLIDEAFRTAEGIFHAGWSEEGFGYWFQTPEGWTVNGHYRSLAYMRPLSIWAMQSALDLCKSSNNAPKEPAMDKGCSFSSHVGLSALTGALGKVQKPQLENFRTCLRCLQDCVCKKC